IGGYSYGAIVSVGLGETATGAARPDGVISISGYSKRMAPSRSSSPLVMLHGNLDPTVPYSLATRTCAAWKRAGAPCRLVTLRGAKHSQITWTRRGQTRPAGDRWLR